MITYEKILGIISDIWGISATEILKNNQGQGSQNPEAQEARKMLIYVLKSEKKSFSDIANLLNRSRGNMHTEYKQAVSRLELPKNFKQYCENYQKVASQIYELKHAQPIEEPSPENPPAMKPDKSPDLQNEATTPNQESNHESNFVAGLAPELPPERPSELPTVTLLTPDQSPLAQKVIERDIENIVSKPTATEQKNTEQATKQSFEEDFDFNTDYLEEQGGQAEPSAVPEMKFEKPKTENTNSQSSDGSKIVVSEDAAKFTTETILNGLNFIAVEGTQYYTKFDEKEISKQEQNGQALEGSLELIKKANKNNLKELQEASKNNIYLLEAPLKKVLLTRNIQVSPEGALLFAFVMYAGVMFMTAKRIKEDNERLFEQFLATKTTSKQAA